MIPIARNCIFKSSPLAKVCPPKKYKLLTERYHAPSSLQSVSSNWRMFFKPVLVQYWSKLEMCHLCVTSVSDFVSKKYRKKITKRLEFIAYLIFIEKKSTTRFRWFV